MPRCWRAQGIDAYLVYYYSDRDDTRMSQAASTSSTNAIPPGRNWSTISPIIWSQQKDSNGKVGLVGFSNGGILATGASTLDPKINAAVIYYGTEPWPLRQNARHAFRRCSCCTATPIR